MLERLTPREHPWHSRIPSNQNQIWFRNLIDLHQLTLSWLKAVNREQPAHFIPRGVQPNPDVSSSLWMLDLLGSEGLDPSTELDNLMDDTSPEDVLARLDRTVWAVQSWTLNKLLRPAKESEAQAPRLSQVRSAELPRADLATMNALEQNSWKCGREVCAQRWPGLQEDVRVDLRGVLSAFRDTPLNRSGIREGFLVKRATERQVEIHLLHCPHQTPYEEVSPMADHLCALHAHWIRGYLYSINTKITVESDRRGERCEQRWSIL